MRVLRSREWWLARIDGEPDCFIGAGAAGPLPDGLYKVEQPTRAQRWFRFLGFRHPARPTDRPIPGMVESGITVDAAIHFDWRDRLRILVSGRVTVASLVKTDVEVRHAHTLTNVGVLPPGGIE